MALDPKLLEILACPEDKGPLLYFEDESSLYNPRLQRRYRVEDDIPIMLIDEAETVDDAEHARLLAKAEADGIRPTFAAEPSGMSVDSLGVLECLRHWPEQLTAAHDAAAEELAHAALPNIDDLDNVVFCGMGGSGIVGDVVATVGTGSLPVPVVVLKQYRTPAFVGRRTMVFAISYSGNTEETLAMAEGALDAGAQLVTISSGGELEALGAARGRVHHRCADSFPGPRLALGAMVAPALVTLFKMGFMPEAHAGLVLAQERLARRRDECVPEIEGDRNPARELARKIGRTIPLIYGMGGLGAVAAKRWKQSMNENAKVPAFWNQYPELDHNEICGWGQHGDVTRQVFTLLELRHGFAHPRLHDRALATRALVEEAVVQILEVEAGGEGRIAQLLDLIYVGDWTSTYLALDSDVDPGPIDAISQLKAMLGGQIAG